ncbi:hypothetical protein CBL_01396 [Carabus blaptoides fortunei]
MSNDMGHFRLSVREVDQATKFSTTHPTTGNNRLGLSAITILYKYIEYAILEGFALLHMASLGNQLDGGQTNKKMPARDCATERSAFTGGYLPKVCCVASGLWSTHCG